MIPYFQQPQLHLGPLTLYAFGTLVAGAVFLGYHLSSRRAERQGLDPALCERMLSYGLGIGFVGAHLYSALAYFPERVRAEPLYLLKIWDGISSFGGIVAGLAGVWLFFRFRQRGLAPEERWRYLDAVLYAFPFAWVLGRLGCTVAHDHPGRVTDFFLGVSLRSAEAQAYIRGVYQSAGMLRDLPPPGTLASLAFHDLGWYEFLYTLLVVAPLTYLLGRTPRPPGFFLASFLLLYTPVRFAFDFLRVADERYAHLTPAQWMAAAAFVGAGALLLRIRRRTE